MIVIGLTGSIGMGKSTVARQFYQCGVAVCDSDALVHMLLGRHGDAVQVVAKHFPATYREGAIDRAQLGKEVFGDAEKIAVLEGILHPHVRRLQKRFFVQMQRQRKRCVVLDIPLLFETGREKQCDYTVVVTAPAFLQTMRVLSRPRMTVARFQDILARQMPDHEKRRRADFVVRTGLGKYASLKAVKHILYRLGVCAR